MGEITAIEVQSRRADRRSIFVDGQFATGAHQDVVATLNLRVGQRFDADQLAQVVRKETARKAMESALRLISYRDRSETEIRRRLSGNDFAEDIVDEVVVRLTNMGLLNDQTFSRNWVKSRTAAKPMGRRRLVWELQSKGVSADNIEQALDGLDEQTEDGLALELARNRATKSDVRDPKFRDKTASFLMRRGFNWDTVARVLDEICPRDED
ncbi:MAG: regulatory protein RecX [Armatimonadota bacterium]